MEETIVRIRPQDASLFSGLDPFERLEMLSMPNHFALATIERDGQGEVIPAGLMVAHTMDDTLCINWLGVDPSRQGNGIGDRLLLKAYEIADGGGINNLCAMYSTEYQKSNFGEFGKMFLEERFFEEKATLPPEFIGALSDLSEFSYMKQDIKKFPTPTALSKLSPAQVKSVIMQLDNISGSSKFCPVAGLKEKLDLDISFVFLDEDEAYSGILIRNIDGCLLPVYFHSESDSESAALILHALQAAKDKYDANTDVEIFVTSEELNPLMDKVLNELKAHSKLLVADLDEYRAYRG